MLVNIITINSVKHACFFCKEKRIDCRTWKVKINELEQQGGQQKVRSAVSIDDDSINEAAFTLNEAK